MKALGIVRNIDDLGRVVLPKEVRDTQGWKAGQPMEMFMDGENLILKPYGAAQKKAEAIENLYDVLDLAKDKHIDEKLRSVLEFLGEK
jgi:AbrB family looped-hinge helix DNA binding protein